MSNRERIQVEVPVFILAIPIVGQFLEVIKCEAILFAQELAKNNTFLAQEIELRGGDLSSLPEIELPTGADALSQLIIAQIAILRHMEQRNRLAVLLIRTMGGVIDDLPRIAESQIPRDWMRALGVIMNEISSQMRLYNRIEERRIQVLAALLQKQAQLQNQVERGCSVQESESGAA